VRKDWNPGPDRLIAQLQCRSDTATTNGASICGARETLLHRSANSLKTEAIIRKKDIMLVSCWAEVDDPN
jgi:hypothetical protein